MFYQKEKKKKVILQSLVLDSSSSISYQPCTRYSALPFPRLLWIWKATTILVASGVDINATLGWLKEGASCGYAKNPSVPLERGHKAILKLVKEHWV